MKSIRIAILSLFFAFANTASGAALETPDLESPAAAPVLPLSPVEPAAIDMLAVPAPKPVLAVWVMRGERKVRTPEPIEPVAPSRIFRTSVYGAHGWSQTLSASADAWEYPATLGLERRLSAHFGVGGDVTGPGPVALTAFAFRDFGRLEGAGRVNPFVLGGVASSLETFEPAVAGGGGIRVSITEQLDARLGARALYFPRERVWSSLVSYGVGWSF